MRAAILLLGILVGVAATLLVVSGGLYSVRAACDDEPCPNPPCCNGDCNGDAGIDIADAIYLLAYLFGSGPEPLRIATQSGECPSVEGEWVIQVKFRCDECEVPPPPEPFKVTVKQDGCAITVVSEREDEFRGVVCGTLAYWSGTAPYDGGEMRIRSFARLDEREKTLEGVTAWTLVTIAETCEGVEVWEAQQE